MAFNAASDSSRTALRMVPETTVGTPPVTANMYEVEITGESLNTSRESTVSQSFRSDRQVPGVTATGETSGGDINTELKYASSTHMLLTALLQSETALADGVVAHNGVTRRSFTVEKHFTDATGDGAVQLFYGAEIASAAFSMQTGNLITVNYTLMARDADETNASIADSIIAAPTTQFMTAVADGVVLKINDVEYAGGLQSLDFTLDNNAREQRQIASTALAGVGMGRSSTTGSLTAYFNGANPLATAFKNHENVKIEIEIPDTDGNKYNFIFWSVNMTAKTVVAGGLDQDVVMEVQWQAVKGAEHTFSIGATDA